MPIHKFHPWLRDELHALGFELLPELPLKPIVREAGDGDQKLRKGSTCRLSWKP